MKNRNGLVALAAIPLAIGTALAAVPAHAAPTHSGGVLRTQVEPANVNVYLSPIALGPKNDWDDGNNDEPSLNQDYVTPNLTFTVANGRDRTVAKGRTTGVARVTGFRVPESEFGFTVVTVDRKTGRKLLGCRDHAGARLFGFGSGNGQTGLKLEASQTGDGKVANVTVRAFGTAGGQENCPEIKAQYNRWVAAQTNNG